MARHLSAPALMRCTRFVVMLLASIGSPARGAAQVAVASPGASLSDLLARATEAARAGDPALRAARAALVAAERRRAATGYQAPLTAAVGLSDGLGGDVTSGNLSVEVSRDLATGRVRAAARASADAVVAAGVAEVRSREMEVDVRVAELLLDAAAAERIAARLERSDAGLAATEEALRSRFAAGAARYVDVLRVRTERLQIATELNRTRAEGDEAAAMLAGLQGAALTPDGLRALVTEAATDARFVEWVAYLDQLPDVDSLGLRHMEVRRAAATVALANASRLDVLARARPQLAASAGLQRIGPDNGGPSVGLLLGLSSTLPFTARVANEGNRAAASADIEWAQFALDAARAQAAVARRTAHDRFVAARARLASFDAALLVAADEERASALSAYRNGELSLLELLDFARALLRVEVERVRALLDVSRARVSLFGLAPFEPGSTP